MATLLCRARNLAPSSIRARAVLPSTLSHPLIHSYRHASSMNPASWLRETLGGNVRKETSEVELEAAKAKQIEAGNANLFDTVEPVLEELETKKKAKKHTEHKYSTAQFKMSHRKLNMLGRQISGKPIDAAILQMVFSEKRASTRIKSMLVVARDHAQTYKGLDREKLVVSEAWVSKGPKLMRFDIKGRGRAGIKHHPKARLTVVLREGKTQQEKLDEARKYKVNKVRSPALVRMDKPIRNPGPMWAW